MPTSTAPKRDVDQILGSRPGTARLGKGKLLWRAAESQRAPASQRRESVGGVRHFCRHLGEMLLAMVVGMMALGALDRVILAAAGTNVSDVRDSAPEVVALVMAFNMTVGMTVWMRHRGHSWARVADMAAAMFIPAVAVIVLFWCAVIHSAGALVGLEHAAMLPAMIAVMLLHRSEYSQPVHAHAPKVV